MKLAEDHRDNLVVILAGYEGEMVRLLAANPGMASRFPTTITFEDYSGEELLAIADSLVKSMGLAVSQGAKNKLKSTFTVLASKPSVRYFVANKSSILFIKCIIILFLL